MAFTAKTDRLRRHIEADLVVEFEPVGKRLLRAEDSHL
jgi:hypothetical protein